MTKIWKFILGAGIALFPYTARADLDLASIVQGILSTVQEEANALFKEYTNFQMSLQELTSNRDMVDLLKKEVMAQVNQRGGVMGLLDTVSMPGISDKIKGPIATPELGKEVDALYSVKTTSKTQDDVAKVTDFEAKMNDLRIENAAIIYARSLVLRKKIMAEEETINKEEKAELTDLPQVIEAYKTVSARANGRWRSILAAAAGLEAQLIQGALNAAPVDNDISDAKED